MTVALSQDQRSFPHTPGRLASAIGGVSATPDFRCVLAPRQIAKRRSTASTRQRLRFWGGMLSERGGRRFCRGTAGVVKQVAAAWKGWADF